MRADVGTIDALERAILNEANAEVEQIRTAAEAKAAAIRQRAREQAENERRTILEKAKQEAERVRSQFIATSQLKARTLELERREKLLNDVFNAAREQLASIQKQKDYEAMVAQLLREAVFQLKVDKAQVRADKQTQKILEHSVIDIISKELKAEISVGPLLEQGTGLIVDAADGHLRYDNTLENRLNRKQNELRAAVYQVLTGESR